MDVDLHQWAVADGFEAVNFAGFDDEDIAGRSFEGLSVDGPDSAALAYKLDFIVGMPMWARTFAGQSAE